jgi:hypothetical protein
MPGAGRARPSVLIVADSQRILLVDANEAVVAPWDAVLLSRGEYLRLLDLDMQVLSGDLIPRQR